MHAAIYRYHTDQRGDEVVRLGQNELVPMTKQMPGFVAHYVADLGNNQAVILAVFQTEAQVRHFHNVALDWIQKRVASQFGHPYNQPPIEAIFGHLKTRNTPTEEHIDVKP